MANFTTVAKVGSIPEGEGATFPLGDRLVAVFLHRGEYFAIDDLCPHMGASLGAGQLNEEGQVTCPWHAWRFDICDGTWCDNPRLKIDAFTVRIQGDEIQVAVKNPPNDSSPNDSSPRDESATANGGDQSGNGQEQR
jgi:nitrite reductase (NADH) small subunit/3-phenylpropionate/trans-cinnamate dioxygenase ferredoxin subunit